MTYLQSVKKGIDFIEANLDFDISLSQVSKEAGLSQWHFQRIFKALTNETLKTYIRSRRLANSLDKLLATNIGIIDIAISAGYESQESFTRAFKTAFDLTPNEYRKMGDKNLFLKKIEFDLHYLEHINQNISLVPEIVVHQPMTLVGMRTEFYSVASEKNNIADKLPSLWGEFMSRIGDVQNSISGKCYGVVQQIKEDTDRLEYFAAIEVSTVVAIPEGMQRIDIPLTRCAVFTHQGDASQIDNTVNYIYSSWLLNAGERHTGRPDLEIYGHEYNPNSKDSVMYYAVPIK